MAATDWRLTAGILLGLPLAVAGPAFLARRASRQGRLARRAEGDVSARAQETLAGQAMIRTFDLRRSFQESFRARVDQLFRRSLRFYYQSNLTKRMPNLSVQLLHLALMLAGGWLAFRGELGVGALIAFNFLFLNVSSAVLDLSVTLGPLLQAGLAFDHLLPELVERRPDEPRRGPPRPAPRAGLARDLRLEGIRFGYGAGKLALDGVSLTLLAGCRTAIVGPSGSGKSTLAALLVGLHPLQDGRILWDGEELSQARRAAFLTDLGVVFQDNPVFNASLRHNILLGQTELPRGPELERRLEACLEAAGLAEWIRELPEGLMTPAGEDGGFLSGGQRQRLALARALFREPALLVLDEATSALDPLTERHVNDTLRGLAGSTTIVHITHRLAGIADYDQIIVLQDGRVAEAGRHTELLAAGGLYAALWNRQAGLELDAGATSARISVEALRNMPLFAASAEATLEGLARNFTSEAHESGSRVIRQGSPGTRFFVIARGRVEVRIRNGDHEEAVATLADGDFFGEMSLLDATLTSASVVATMPTVLLALEKTSFLSLMRADAALYGSVSQTAARRKAENAGRAAGGAGS
jgi:ATP-binding cassette subfamily B protein